MDLKFRIFEKADTEWVRFICAIQNIAVYLVKELQEKNKCTQEEALLNLMKTAVYEALMDKETKLYCESRESVLDMLLGELDGHVEKLLEI